MGQKIHPTGFRLAVTRDWSSRWYANSKDFAGMLNEDVQVRDYLKAKLKSASVGRVLIERPAKNARVTIFSARPGLFPAPLWAYWPQPFSFPAQRKRLPLRRLPALFE